LVETNLLEDKKQFKIDLDSAKTQIEALMITDITSFRLKFQSNETKEKNEDSEEIVSPRKEKKKIFQKKKKKKGEKKMEEKKEKRERKNSFADTPLRDILKRIKKDLYLQQQFEKILNQEKNISYWYFWKDINNIIEMQIKETNQFFSLFQKISRDYLNEESPHEVFIYIYLFILYFYNLFIYFIFIIYFYFLFYLFIFFFFLFIFFFLFLQ
jgi:hypothetical protein